jgi:4,5-DOPA dioxygenase extradiol
MFALEPGRAGPLLTQLGKQMQKPKAILIMSPHWITRGLAIGASDHPATIYDFGGFDPKLQTLKYPASGSRAVAQRVAQLLTHSTWFEQTHCELTIEVDQGLDHGIWVPLLHLFPQVDVPVVPLSMPNISTPEFLFKLGQILAPLADEGVLIIGSGSLTHNLSDFRQNSSDQPAAYASEFVDWISDAVVNEKIDQIQNYLTLAPHARRAHPTPEHFLPLPFALGAAQKLQLPKHINGESDQVVTTVLNSGISNAVLSMQSYAFS